MNCPLCQSELMFIQKMQVLDCKQNITALGWNVPHYWINFNDNQEITTHTAVTSPFMLTWDSQLKLLTIYNDFERMDVEFENINFEEFVSYYHRLENIKVFA